MLKEATAYDYGTAAADIVKPADPTKAATAQYTYSFAGWSPAIAEVTGDVTYTATYSSTVNKYNVTFVDEDGTTVLKEATAYDYGTAAADIVKPADPTKAATAQYTYEFAGWSPAIAEVTGDATYTATYTEVLVEPTSVTFNGVTGSFNDKIKLNYYFEIPQDVLDDKGSYVTITKTNGETGKTETIKQYVKDAKYFTDKGYKFSIELVAKEASDTITAKVFDGNNQAITIKNSDGKDYTDTGVQKTLMEYFAWLETDGKDAAEKAVGKAAKDYCTAAQIYFNYNTSDLGPMSDAVEGVKAEDLNDYEAIRSANELPKGVSIRGISAMLESDNTLRLYLKFDEGYDPESFTYKIDENVVDLKQRKTDGAYYLALGTGVYSNRLQEKHIYSVSDDTNTFTYEACVLTYARSCVIKNQYLSQII